MYDKSAGSADNNEKMLGKVVNNSNPGVRSRSQFGLSTATPDVSSYFGMISLRLNLDISSFYTSFLSKRSFSPMYLVVIF